MKKLIYALLVLAISSIALASEMTLLVERKKLRQYLQWEGKHILLKDSSVTSLVKKPHDEWQVKVFSKDKQVIGYISEEALKVFNETGMTQLANHDGENDNEFFGPKIKINHR